MYAVEAVLTVRSARSSCRPRRSACPPGCATISLGDSSAGFTCPSRTGTAAMPVTEHRSSAAAGGVAVALDQRVTHRTERTVSRAFSRAAPLRLGHRPERKKAPRSAGLFPCAEEDSNLHGPFSPQGPQLCRHLTAKRCNALLSQVRARARTMRTHRAGRLVPRVVPRCATGQALCRAVELFTHATSLGGVESTLARSRAGRRRVPTSRPDSSASRSAASTSRISGPTSSRRSSVPAHRRSADAPGAP